jgi:hypothetical protein
MHDPWKKMEEEVAKAWNTLDWVGRMWVFAICCLICYYLGIAEGAWLF